MTGTYGYAPSEKMLDPTALAEKLRVSEPPDRRPTASVKGTKKSKAVQRVH